MAQESHALPPTGIKSDGVYLFVPYRMEEGTKAKKTVFVGGISDDTDEAALYETFATFGDIIEVQIPPAQTNQHNVQPTDTKHRGFAFVTFTSPADAQDAIDNMDMNELKGRVLKVNLAKPMKVAAAQPQGNRAIWENEEWLKQYVKPLEKGGPGGQNRQGSTEAAGNDGGEDDDRMEE